MKKVGEDLVQGLTNIATLVVGGLAVAFVALFVLALVVLVQLPEILKVLLS